MKFIAFIISIVAVVAATSIVIQKPVDHAKRGIICNTQDYDPMTAKRDIELCRLGINKNLN